MSNVYLLFLWPFVSLGLGSFWALETLGPLGSNATWAPEIFGCFEACGHFWSLLVLRVHGPLIKGPTNPRAAPLAPWAHRGPPVLIREKAIKFPRGSRFPVTEFWPHQGAPSFTALDRQGPIMWEIFPDTWIWSHFLQVPTTLPTPTLEKGANIFWNRDPTYPCLPRKSGVPRAWDHQGCLRLFE